jgi:succinate dehydrogenase / fumarate reductase, flavoprotein subunit
MMIYPAVHYTMGGIWVDYELMTSVQGLYALGEANFSDHGANRLGASALMQGLADGYFVLPYTIQTYLSGEIRIPRMDTGRAEFAEAEKSARERLEKLSAIRGTKTVDHFHKELGKIMWENVGMGRTEASLKKAIELIRKLREDFWKDVKVPGTPDEMNIELEKANRVADFLELGELLALDALTRNESCGGHFREEYQTGEGECLRDDENFMYVAAWEYVKEGDFKLNKEPLKFEEIEVKQRVYK